MTKSNNASVTTTTASAAIERFIAATKVHNADIDVLLEDVRDGRMTLGTIIDEALDHREVIYVVDKSKTKAKEAAAAFNELYAAEYQKVQDAQASQAQVRIEKEEKKVANPKEVVASAFEAEKKESLLKTKEAQAFMNKHSAAVKNAQKAPVKKEEAAPTQKEEKRMTTTNTEVKMGNAAAIKQEEEKAMMNTNTEVKGNAAPAQGTPAPRRRLSTDAPEVNGGKAERSSRGGRRILRTESIRQQFVKHEGPWYLNAELYPVLSRFESILETMSDAELGIQNIVLVDPDQLQRYERKLDVTVVIQVMSNGVVLEFPIKDSKSQTSKSDLSSTSIGWVPTKNGMRPAFGFYRSNFPVVSATCTCGKAIENASASNLYCRECKTRHDDAQVSISHKALSLKVEEFTFQTIPTMEVPKDILALVMAIAQYDAELPMHGIIEE